MVVKKVELEASEIGHTWIQWLIAILANFASFGYGLECGWISPTSKVLKSAASPTGSPVPDTTIAWIASSMNLAAVFGVPVFAYLADTYGRKVSVLVITLPQAISWIIRATYCSTTSLIIARAIAGIAAGGIFNIIPMFVKELSQDNIRGTLGSLLVLAQNIGIFTMYIIGAYFDYYTVTYIVVGLPIVTAILMMLAPETPEFLVKQGKIDKAIETIALLRGLDRKSDTVRKEVEAIKCRDDYFKTLPEVSLKNLLNEKYGRKILLLLFIMYTSQAHNGAGVIITYAFPILVSSGASFNISPELQTLSIPCVMIMASLTLTFLVERFKRKRLLAGAFVITAFAMTTLGATMLAQNLGGTMPSWLPMLVMILIVAMYAGALSPIPYIILTEILNFQLRAKVMGGVVAYAWFSTFLTISAYPLIASSFGQYSAFFLYAITNTFGAIFILICIPETKGKSDEDICRELCGKNKDTP